MQAKVASVLLTLLASTACDRAATPGITYLSCPFKGIDGSEEETQITLNEYDGSYTFVSSRGVSTGRALFQPDRVILPGTVFTSTIDRSDLKLTAVGNAGEVVIQCSLTNEARGIF